MPQKKKKIKKNDFPPILQQQQQTSGPSGEGSIKGDRKMYRAYEAGLSIKRTRFRCPMRYDLFPDELETACTEFVERLESIGWGQDDMAREVAHFEMVLVSLSEWTFHFGRA